MTLSFPISPQADFGAVVSASIPPPPPLPQTSQATAVQLPVLIAIESLQEIPVLDAPPITVIPTPQQLDLNTIPEPLMNIDLIKIPDVGSSIEG